MFLIVVFIKKIRKQGLKPNQEEKFMLICIHSLMYILMQYIFINLWFYISIFCKYYAGQFCHLFMLVLPSPSPFFTDIILAHKFQCFQNDHYFICIWKTFCIGKKFFRLKHFFVIRRLFCVWKDFCTFPPPYVLLKLLSAGCGVYSKWKDVPALRKRNHKWVKLKSGKGWRSRKARRALA